MQTTEQKQDTDVTLKTRRYEVSYLIVPFVDAEKAAGKAEEIKNYLIKEGGEVLNEGSPKNIVLAYTMDIQHGGKKQKCESAYFGWVRVSCAPEAVECLHANLKKDSEIIRFLIVKVPRDVELSKQRRSVSADVSTRPKLDKRKEEDKPQTKEKISHSTIDEEKLDKEIEELLATS